MDKRVNKLEIRPSYGERVGKQWFITHRTKQQKEKRLIVPVRANKDIRNESESLIGKNRLVNEHLECEDHIYPGLNKAKTHA